jgi:hypothetical protein
MEGHSVQQTNKSVKITFFRMTILQRNLGHFVTSTHCAERAPLLLKGMTASGGRHVGFRVAVSKPQQGNYSADMSLQSTTNRDFASEPEESRQSRTSDARHQAVTRRRATEDTNNPSECNAWAGAILWYRVSERVFPAVCSPPPGASGALTVQRAEWLTTSNGAKRTKAAADPCRPPPGLNFAAERRVHSIPPSPTTSSSPPGAHLLAVPERVRPPHPTGASQES